MIRLLLVSCLLLPYITCQLFASGPIQLDNQPRAAAQVALPTVTVRGFLNFRTTVDGTVIVFTPASSSSSAPESSSIQPSSSSFSYTPFSANPFTYSSSAPRNEWSSSYTPRVRISESSQVIEPTSTTASSVYPTGLVTVLGQTEVNQGLTTVHETKVIGTYIEGKYAQILKSSSFISVGHTPTPVLPTKTFAVFPPSITGDSDRPVSDVIENGIEKPPKIGTVTRITRNQRERRPPISFRSRTNDGPPSSTPAPSRARRPTRPEGRFAWQPKERERDQVRAVNRFKVKIAGSELPQTSRFTARDENEKEAAKLLNARLNRRLGVPRPVIEKPTTPQPTIDTSSAEDKPIYNPPLLEGELSDLPLDLDQEPRLSPQRVVTETQTYMSEITHLFDGLEPYIETVTLTTAIERTLDPSEVDIISPSGANTNDLRSSSLPPIIITKTYSLTESSSRTSLFPVVDGTVTATHTITENFIIHKLITAYKTLPAGDEQLLENALLDMDNSNYLDHLSVADAQIVPSIFNGNLDIPIITTTPAMSDPMKATELPSLSFLNGGSVQQLQPSLDFNPGMSNNFNNNFGPQIDLNNPLVLGAALQNPGLAAMYFGLQQLSQQATQYTTITKPTEYLTTDTIFNTKTLSFYDGRQTRTRTITEPASFATRLISTTTTEVSPVINPQYLVQQAQLQRIFATQLLNQNQNKNDQSKDGTNLFAVANAAVQPQMPQNFHLNQNMKPSYVTSTQVTVVTSTETSTKVYTLIYNALSTKFRTVTSTNIFPTTVTTLVTKTITNTAPFPSFFG